jgi:hypothetical protein
VATFGFVRWEEVLDQLAGDADGRDVVQPLVFQQVRVAQMGFDDVEVSNETAKLMLFTPTPPGFCIVVIPRGASAPRSPPRCLDRPATRQRAGRLSASGAAVRDWSWG